MTAFPVTPPRAPPSPAPLLASIRSLIQSGALSGPAWKSTATWRSQIRKAFAAYHALLKDVAEELVTARAFAEEFHLFLDQIAQPIQLLQLIAEDFESEFGPGATRGLLGVGEAGGDNLISVMDFCAAKKPSELIARVKLRVAEKQERERRTKLLDKLKAELKELDVRIRGLLLEYRSASGTGGAQTAAHEGGDDDAAAKAGGPAQVDESEAGSQSSSPSADRSELSARLQQELEVALDERDRVKAELEDLKATEEADELARKKRAIAEKKGLTLPARNAGGAAATGDGAGQATRDEAGFKLGSSRDLLSPQSGSTSETAQGSEPSAAPSLPVDPFSASAPRAVSSTAGSAKGKAKAATQTGKVSRWFSRLSVSSCADAISAVASYCRAIRTPASSASIQPASASLVRQAARPRVVFGNSGRSAARHQFSFARATGSQASVFASDFDHVFAIAVSRTQGPHCGRQVEQGVKAGKAAHDGCGAGALRDVLSGLSRRAGEARRRGIDFPT